MKFNTLSFSTLFFFVVFLISFLARAEHIESRKSKPIPPAHHFEGRTAVSLGNGIPFNNGTQGERDATYEQWAAAPLIFPGVSETNYDYGFKQNLLDGLEENSHFAEAAIANWKTVTPNTKPEAKAYGENAASTIQPLLERLNGSIRAVKSAGSGDWSKAQSDARRALVELRATYMSLHRNVR